MLPRYSFGLVLDFGVPHRLPLHVARTIGAAALQRNNVVHYVARALARRATRRWAWMAFLEIVLRLRAAFNSAMAVSHDADRLIRTGVTRVRGSRSLSAGVTRRG